jgi:two-component system, response regulator PdtaR
MMATDGDLDAPAAARVRPEPVMSRHEPRVLVVEDEALIALNAEAILQEAGFTVTGIAATYAQARALADALPPDVAVVDLNLLDGRTGLRVAEHVHGMHGAMVVIATGNPEGIEAGGAIRAVLRKPYDDAALARAALEALAVGARGRLFASPRPRGN